MIQKQIYSYLLTQGFATTPAQASSEGPWQISKTALLSVLAEAFYPAEKF